jgi:hypothetical protein
MTRTEANNAGVCGMFYCDDGLMVAKHLPKGIAIVYWIEHFPTGGVYVGQPWLRINRLLA